MIFRIGRTLPVAFFTGWPRSVLRVAEWLVDFSRMRRRFYVVKPWWAFVGWLTLEAGAVNRATCAFVYYVLELSPPRSAGFRISWGDYILFSCVWVPVEETVLYQLLPIEFLRCLGFPVSAQLALSWFTFAAMHYAGGGWGHAFGPGLVGGFYLAWAYLHFRRISIEAAAGVTVLVHALHNFFRSAQK